MDIRRSAYPAIAGVLAGVLIAGLPFRLSSQVPSSTGALSGSASGSSSTTGDASTESPGGSKVAPGIHSSGGGGATGATGGQGGGTTTGATGATGSTGKTTRTTSVAPLTATDVGVTATSIKVGIALLSVGVASSFVAIPGQDPTQQRKQWQAYIDEINKSGGILGRKLQPFYQTVDVTDTASGQAACTTFTETDHVFAVFSGNTGMSADCLALQHRTLDIGDMPFAPPATVHAAGGLLISRGPTGMRAFADWARALEHLGKLKGRTLGLIVDQEAQALTKTGLVPTLQSMGYKITYTAVVSKDPSQGPTQSSTQVPQMKAAGVDTVLDATTFANMAAFVSAADKQQWKPQYIVNSYDGNDVGLFYSGMPASWNGALAITYYDFFAVKGRKEQAVVTDCRDRYNKQTGSAMGPKDANVTQLVLACADLNLMVAAGRLSGPDLTRGRFSAAVQSLGSSFVFAGMGGSFGSGKLDWDDQVRPMIWGPDDGSSTGYSGPCDSNNSRCWNDAGPAFRPSA